MVYVATENEGEVLSIGKTPCYIAYTAKALKQS